MSIAWRPCGDHVLVSVRLTPNGGHDAIDGIETGADDIAYLKIRVAVAPEKGKANKALIALVAKTLRMPKTALSIVSGETARKKILRIDGNPEDVMKQLEKWEKA